MKRLFYLLIFILVSTKINAQETIVLTESALPYISQTWFSCGDNVDESKIKSNWDEERRITAVAYTSKGWLFTMAKNSGIGMQTYKISTTWPDDWIKKCWDEDYYISSIAYGNNKWTVIMSQGEGYTSQTWKRSDWNSMKTWIKECWDKDFYITHTSYNGSKWTVIMSKHPKFISQGYLWASTSEDLKEKVRSVWNEKGSNVQVIQYGAGEYFLVYCKYKENNDREQNYNLNPSDFKEYVNNMWDKSQDIAFIGGGVEQDSYNQNSNSSSTYNNNNNNNPSTTRQQLPGGGYIEYVRHEDGGLTTITSERCNFCSGTAVCSICGGMGGRYGPTGMWYVCTSCGGLKRCQFCDGTGVRKTTSYIKDGQGYMVGTGGYVAQSNAGGTIVTGPRGTTVYPKGGSEPSSSSNNNSSNHNSGSNICPKCGGKKYQSTSYSAAAASTAGWMQPYHHTGGAGCPHCNSVSDHYHYPCTECHGYGHIR